MTLFQIFLFSLSLSFSIFLSLPLSLSIPLSFSLLLYLSPPPLRSFNVFLSLSPLSISLISYSFVFLFPTSLFWIFSKSQPSSYFLFPCKISLSSSSRFHYRREVWFDDTLMCWHRSLDPECYNLRCYQSDPVDLDTKALTLEVTINLVVQGR